MPSLTVFELLFCFSALSFVAAGESPPVFERQPETQIVAEGAPLSLRCRANADPFPSYRWIRDGSYITVLENPTPAVATFQIEGVTRRDAGDYRCFARNAHGASISETSNVTVAFLSSFLPGAEYDLEALEGDPVVLRPPVLDAQPQDAIRWEWRYSDVPVSFGS